MPADLDAAAAAIDAFLRALGHELEGELEGTGARVAQAYAHELLSGYAADPAAILSERCQSEERGVVAVQHLHALSLCPHHLLPAAGEVHVAYLPEGELLGLGAIAALVACLSRRLVLQETLGRQIAEALVDLGPARSALVRIDYHQGCLAHRGPRQVDAITRTLSFAGEQGAEERTLLLAAMPTP